MTAPTEQPLPGAEPADSKPKPDPDVERILIIATMVIVGFLSLWTVRNVIVRPFDGLATQQVCRWHGVETDQTVVEHERSNKVGLLNRSDASCTFAPAEEGGVNEVVRIGTEDESQIDPGPFYTLAKVLGLVFQVLLTYGAVQAALRALAYFRGGVDPGEWVVVLVLAVLAFVALSVARNAIVVPLDNLVAQQVCRSHGEEIGQPLVDSERANTFTLGEETEGFCQYGPGAGPEGEELPAARLTIAESTPSALYQVSKVIGVILQLGAASMVLRFLVDPVFEFYRSVRRKLKAA